MTENLYANAMVRAENQAASKGHDLGEWQQRLEGQGYAATCKRCGGELTVSGTPKMFLIGADPYMSLDFCPGDNPELMKAIDEEFSRRLARCYQLLLRKAAERRAIENQEERAGI